jgi:hypothetical protein
MHLEEEAEQLTKFLSLDTNLLGIYIYIETSVHGSHIVLVATLLQEIN